MWVLRGPTRERIELSSKPLHQGGEGALYSIARYPNEIAKVMFKPSSTLMLKLDALRLTLPSQSSSYLFTRPLDVLFSEKDSTKCIGYVMPHCTTFQALYLFLRGTRSGHVSARDVLEFSRHVSEAFAAAHRVGVVIGDVNESNVGLTTNTQAVLLDTDSYQIQTNGRVFRCPVGRPEFTPPELQGKKFKDVDRTASSDAFGLGVILFELFMQGAHPFAALYSGSGNPLPLAKRIKHGLFPHSVNGVPKYHPPKNLVRFTDLPHRIQDLFHDCFEAGHRDPNLRPSADEWLSELSRLTPQDLLRKSQTSTPSHGKRNYLTTLRSSFRIERLRNYRTRTKVALIAAPAILCGTYSFGSYLLAADSDESPRSVPGHVGKETPKHWVELSNELQGNP